MEGAEERQQPPSEASAVGLSEAAATVSADLNSGSHVLSCDNTGSLKGGGCKVASPPRMNATLQRGILKMLRLEAA